MCCRRASRQRQQRPSACAGRRACPAAFAQQWQRGAAAGSGLLLALALALRAEAAGPAAAARCCRRRQRQPATGVASRLHRGRHRRLRRRGGREPRLRGGAHGAAPRPASRIVISTLAALARSPEEQKWRRQGQGRGSAKRAGSAAAALGNAEDELRASTAPVSEALDRVAEAMSLRERMAQRGIEESDVTRSTLFRLYADTPMAESVAASAARPAAQARPLAAGSAARSAAGSAGAGSAAAGSAAAADSAAAATEPATDTAGRLRRSLEEGARSSREIWQLLDDGSLAAEGLDAPLVLTDLRGLTRAAAALELRHELTRAAQRFELGIGASGRGEDPLAMEPSVRSHWAIVAGAEARRTQSSGVARHADSQPQLSAQRGGAPKVTLRTALEFLFAEGIEYEQKRPGLLLVPPDEYERAAARMANRMRRQKLRDGLVYYWCFVASGLATMSIIPRLDHLVGGLGGGGLPGA